MTKSRSRTRTQHTQGAWALLARLAPWFLIGGLVLFHALNNWVWLAENVTWAGWDKPRHLAHSLNYAQMLSPISIQSLFEVMVSDPIRPPLFPASASIMYALFGRTADVATMINVLYMAIALAATYGLGKRWGDRRLGLISVVLLALFPMFYVMSRHFYLEFAMMAMVALTVFFLMAADGFQRRGTSLLFGLSLGLGLLTKRTFAVFVVGPILVTILSSGLLPALWQRLKQRPRIHWKSLLIALLGGAAAAGIWYLPNTEMAQTLILGQALFFLWWALAALTIYFVTLPSAPLSNSLAAIFLAAGLASTWYLARVEFVQRVALYGYGINDPRGRALRLDQLDTYLYYLRKLGNEHLSSVLLVLLAIVFVMAVVVYVRRQGSVRKALGRVRPEGWAVVTWLGGAYVLLTLSIYHETRAFTPALPAAALLFGAALLKLPWRWIRRGILALVVAFGLLQFMALTYEPVQQILPPKTVDLPVWGPTSTFAQGVFIQLPDEGQTDRGYWIEPDVLQRMEEQRLALGRETASLGLLVNTTQINTGQFIYLILTEYPNLRAESLIDSYDDATPYRRVYANDYLAIKHTGNLADPAQEALIDQILSDPPLLFDQAYELEHAYNLPDGGTVYLYRQRHPLPPETPVEYVTHLATDLSTRTQGGDAILLTPPELIAPFASEYAGAADVYLVPESQEELANIAAAHRRIFLVLGEAGTGEVQGHAQGWLNANGFRASHQWADSLQVIAYGMVAGVPAVTPTVQLGATLGNEAELVGYALPPGSWRPGDIVPLTLFWQRKTPIPKDDNVFVHLLNDSGQPVAQTDSAPAGGSHPSSGWREGEIIVDRHGLLLPDDLPAGEYQLLTGLYLPETGERLPARGPSGQELGDSVPLGRLTVASP